jgi:hypothetical protein
VPEGGPGMGNRPGEPKEAASTGNGSPVRGSKGFTQGPVRIHESPDQGGRPGWPDTTSYPSMMSGASSTGSMRWAAPPGPYFPPGRATVTVWEGQTVAADGS